MAKGKDVRVTIILECTSCVRNDIKKESAGISRYIECLYVKFDFKNRNNESIYVLLHIYKYKQIK